MYMYIHETYQLIIHYEINFEIIIALIFLFTLFINRLQVVLTLSVVLCNLSNQFEPLHMEGYSEVGLLSFLNHTEHIHLFNIMRQLTNPHINFHMSFSPWSHFFGIFFQETVLSS